MSCRIVLCGWPPCLPNVGLTFPMSDLRFLKSAGSCGTSKAYFSKKLQEQFVSPDPGNVLGRVKLQGPWGCTSGGYGQEFYDMATSIRSIELGYVKEHRLSALFKVTYEILGKIFTRESYLRSDDPAIRVPRYKTAKIELQPDIEYIKQISGFLSEFEDYNGPYVSSVTIHTNLGTYGPFGKERGREFSSDTGSRVIGFHGEGSLVLNRLGVVTIPDI